MPLVASSEEQVEILRLIWSEMKALNGRIDGVRDDLHKELTSGRVELKTELAALRSELRAEDDATRRRLTETEVRLATAVTELSGETRALASLIRDWREEHRTDRADLRARVDRIEEHLGLPR